MRMTMKVRDCIEKMGGRKWLTICRASKLSHSLPVPSLPPVFILLLSLYLFAHPACLLPSPAVTRICWGKGWSLVLAGNHQHAHCRFRLVLVTQQISLEDWYWVYISCCLPAYIIPKTKVHLSIMTSMWLLNEVLFLFNVSSRGLSDRNDFDYSAHF